MLGTRVRHTWYNQGKVITAFQVDQLRIKWSTAILVRHSQIQYPGVAKSIRSDVDNLLRLVNTFNLLPEGLYVQQAADVRLLSPFYDWSPYQSQPVSIFGNPSIASALYVRYGKASVALCTALM